MKPATPPPLAPATPGPGLFAARVMARAERLGLTKKDLAARAELSRQTLDNVLRLGELGESRMPSVRTLLGLATALKVHPYWLVEGLMANLRVAMHLKQLMYGDRAAFVEDVTCPDACVVAPGAHFYKSWMAHNLSEHTWRGRRVVCWDDHVEASALGMQGAQGPVGRLVPDVQSFELGDVPAGRVFGGAVGFTAPMSPGPAASYWVLTGADGRPSFNENIAVWVIVHVEPDPARRAAWPAVLDDQELELGGIGLAARLG